MPETLSETAPQEELISFRNPFEGQTDESLSEAIVDLRTITDSLENQAFKQAGMLVTKRNAEQLSAAYEIKDVLLLSQRCQRLILKAVEKKISEEENSSEQRKNWLTISKNCKSQNKDVEFALRELDSSIDHYKTLYPSNTPHALLRLGATASVMSVSYGISQFLLTGLPVLDKALLVGASAVLFPVAFFNEYYKAAQMFCGSKPKATPNHLIAAKKIATIMENRP